MWFEFCTTEAEFIMLWFQYVWRTQLRELKFKMWILFTFWTFWKLKVFFRLANELIFCSFKLTFVSKNPKELLYFFLHFSEIIFISFQLNWWFQTYKFVCLQHKEDWSESEIINNFSKEYWRRIWNNSEFYHKKSIGLNEANIWPPFYLIIH